MGRFDLKSTGHTRLELGHATGVVQRYWSRAIQNQPLLITIFTSDVFHKYGGGVDDGASCNELRNHYVVLVGHGRVDGQEFWLIRNSFGIGWGEFGYYKLAKSAAKKCALPAGIAFGAKDALKPSVVIKKSPGGGLRELPSPPAQPVAGATVSWI